MWPCPRVHYLISQHSDRTEQGVCVCVCLERMVWLSVSSGYIVELLSQLCPLISSHPTHTQFPPLNFAVSGTLWDGKHRSRHVVMRNKAKRNRSLLPLIAYKQKTIYIILERERDRCTGGTSGPWVRALTESFSPFPLLPVCPHRAELPHDVLED